MRTDLLHSLFRKEEKLRIAAFREAGVEPLIIERWQIDLVVTAPRELFF